MKKIYFAGALSHLVLSVPLWATPAAAQVVRVEVVCPMTGPGVAACAAAGVVLHEISRDRPFSNEGEIAKGGTAARNWVGDRTGLNKGTKWLRARTGIKW